MNNFCIVQLLTFTVTGLLLFCPGCATTPPPFRPRADYSEIPLAPTTFRVIYRDNGSLSPEQVLDLTLLRACQLVKKRGLSYFAVIDEDSSITGQSVFYPGLNHMTLKPRRGLVIKCFEMKPKRIFIFDRSKLEKILQEKLNLNG